jgi:hypothetical protein
LHAPLDRRGSSRAATERRGVVRDRRDSSAIVFSAMATIASPHFRPNFLVLDYYTVLMNPLRVRIVTSLSIGVDENSTQ